MFKGFKRHVGIMQSSIAQGPRVRVFWPMAVSEVSVPFVHPWDP